MRFYTTSFAFDVVLEEEEEEEACNSSVRGYNEKQEGGCLYETGQRAKLTRAVYSSL